MGERSYSKLLNGVRAETRPQAHSSAFSGGKNASSDNRFGSFYRTTPLCVIKRSLCCRPVSVRPSVPMVTFVYCIQAAEDIVKLPSPSGSPITLDFGCRAPLPISKGTSSAEAQNTRGWENPDFRLKSLFISETVRDRPLVAMER